MANIADLIHERRLEMGLSQRKLGEMVGCDQATIMNYEKKVPGPVQNTLRILKALGLEIVIRKREKKA